MLSCTYTASHGISPGTAYLSIAPQTGKIATHGDLVIGDGQRRVVLRDCRVARMTADAGPDGQTWTLEIQDRRWRWPGLGGISGSFNELDQRKKLVPWSIRSPQEIAEMCLQALGEKNYTIVLPPGLPSAIGKNIERYLLLGENFPQTMTNPPTEFDHAPPAEVLARFCDQFGCRVIFDPVTDTVRILPLGVGRRVPAVPSESISPGFVNPRVPAAIGIVGAPVRFQMRFVLEPVAKEWDGSYVPADSVSYAPEIPPQKQVSTVTYTGTNPVTGLIVTLTINPGALNEKKIEFRGTGGTPFQMLERIKNDINKDKLCASALTAGRSGGVLTLTGLRDGVAFGVEAEALNLQPPDTFVAKLEQAAVKKGARTWRFSPPPAFPGVRGTDRLSPKEALDLANQSVFRCYRVLFIDPATGKPPIRVPWYKGKIVRRQQFVLQQTKVEQVVPQERIKGGVDRNNPVAQALSLPVGILGQTIGFKGLGGGILPEFYDGYSRDRAATVHGSVYKGLSGSSVIWTPDGNMNTNQTDRVYCSFTIDPYNQIVTFSSPVYKVPDVPGKGGFCEFPALTLETGCLLRDADTNSFVRWEVIAKLGGSAPIQWFRHEDVAVGVVGRYRGKVNEGPKGNELLGFFFAPGDERDATARANHYLRSHMREYQLSESKIGRASCRERV